MTKETGDAIADTVARLTKNKVRIEKKAHSAPDFAWVWTPWTHCFMHNGWVKLDARWLYRFWKEGKKQERNRKSRYWLDKSRDLP